MKTNKQDFIYLVIAVMLVRGAVLCLSGWNPWAPPAPPYDMEKYWQAKASIRAKIRAEEKLRKRLLLQLELLRKQLAYESQWKEFEELLTSPTLMPEPKLKQMLKIDIPNEELAMRIQGGGEAAWYELQELVKILVKKKRAELYLLQNPAVSATVKMAKIRFPILVAPETTAAGLIFMRQELAKAQTRATMEAVQPEQTPFWTGGPLGFLFALILLLIRWVSNFINFLLRNKETVAMVLFSVAALIAAGMIAGLWRKRY